MHSIGSASPHKSMERGNGIFVEPKGEVMGPKTIQDVLHSAGDSRRDEISVQSCQTANELLLRHCQCGLWRALKIDRIGG